MPRRMRAWLLSLHLYLGLLCAPYLIVYGVSALALHHGWEGTPAAAATRQVSIADERWAGPDEPRARAVAARDALGLVGGVPGGSIESSTEGRLRFQVLRPGRRLAVAIEPGRPATIEETRTGLLSVLRGVHGLTHLERSAVAPLWRVYTHVSAGALVIAVISGVILWGRRGGWLGWALLGTGGTLYAVVLAQVW